jgi:hypothetical protein
MQERLSKVVGRTENIVTPVEGDDIFPILHTRLFESIGDQSDRRAVADAYVDWYEQVATFFPSNSVKPPWVWASWKLRGSEGFPRPEPMRAPSAALGRPYECRAWVSLGRRLPVPGTTPALQQACEGRSGRDLCGRSAAAVVCERARRMDLRPMREGTGSETARRTSTPTSTRCSTRSNPWVMVSAVGENEYCTPLFVATKLEAAPLSTGSSISTDDPFCESPSWSPPRANSAASTGYTDAIGAYWPSSGCWLRIR